MKPRNVIAAVVLGVVLAAGAQGADTAQAQPIGFLGFIVLAIIVVIYLIPTAIAVDKKRSDKNSIVALNLLLSWTFIGWVIALVWALKEPAQVTVIPPTVEDKDRQIAELKRQLANGKGGDRT